MARRRVPPGSLRGLEERVDHRSVRGLSRGLGSLRALESTVSHGDARSAPPDRPRRRGRRRDGPGGGGVEVCEFDRGEPVGHAPVAPPRAASLSAPPPPAGVRWNADELTSGSQGAEPFTVEAFEAVPVAPPQATPRPPGQAPRQAPPVHRPDVPNPSDDEISQDLAAITGRDAAELAAEAAAAGARAQAMARTGGQDRATSAAAGPSGQAGAGGDGPPANPHAVFDRIARNLSFATTFDLGSMALERRLDQFEREVEADEARSRMQQAPAYELGLAELDADLAALKGRPKAREEPARPPAAAAPAPPTPVAPAETVAPAGPAAEAEPVADAEPVTAAPAPPAEPAEPAEPTAEAEPSTADGPADAAEPAGDDPPTDTNPPHPGG